MAPNQTVLAAADAVRAAASTSLTGRMLPDIHTGLTGLPGWDVIAAQAHQIDVPELRWPRSVYTFEAMRRDSQIQGLLTSVFLPIRHMEWYVDPADADEQTAREIAEDLGLPLVGEKMVGDPPGFDFDDHLRLALLALSNGHQIFEESGEIVGDGLAARYRLRQLMQYPPTTIARINITPTGDLRSVQQNTVAQMPEVPADRLLTYVWDKEGANWAGRSILIGIFRNWLAKDSLVRTDVMVHRRFSGIPIVETTDPSVGPEAHKEAALMAQALQAGDGAGASTPYGTRLRLLGVEGTIPNAIDSIRYHDEQMARAFMQMFAELGKTSSGSRALGTTLLDHYALGVLAVAKWTRKSLMLLVRRLVEINYGPGAPLPQIGFRADDHEDITISDLVSAIDSGLIVVDDELEATIRDRANLPARVAGEPGRVPPGAQPALPAPAAAARKRRVARAAAGDASDAATQSQTDFAALQQTYEEALATVTATWSGVQAAQITDLVAQVKAATSTEELAAIQPTTHGAAAILKVLAPVLEHGAAAVVSEAAAQGHDLAAPVLTDAHTALSNAVDGTVSLLSRSLGQSAASKAVALAALPTDEIAAEVQAHLEGLSGAAMAYEFAGLVTKAQNTGRLAAMTQAPDGTRFYASELNDDNVCDPCAAEDETEFMSLDEAESDYPGGGFLGCEGGNRCRGTIVMVMDEAAPSAA